MATRIRLLATASMIAACGTTIPQRQARPQPVAQPPDQVTAQPVTPSQARVARDPAACPPWKHVWCRAISAGASDVVQGLALRPDGGAIVVGGFEGTIDLGGGPRTSRGTFDGFVLALSADGGYLWDHVFGGPGHDMPASVAVGADGAVFVTGGASAPIDLGGGRRPNDGGADAYVLALTPSGSYRWDVQLRGPGYDFGRGIAVGADGTIAVAGHIGDREPQHADGSANVDGLVVALDGAGRERWRWTLASSDWASFDSVAFAGESVVVVGRARGDLKLDDGKLEHHGDMNAIVVARRADNGAPRWRRVIDGSDVATDLAVAPSGDIVVVGYGTDPRPTGFVHALDAGGRSRWSHHVEHLPGWVAVTTRGEMFAGERSVRDGAIIARAAGDSRGRLAIAGYTTAARGRSLFVLATDEPIVSRIKPATSTLAR